MANRIFFVLTSALDFLQIQELREHDSINWDLRKRVTISYRYGIRCFELCLKWQTFWSFCVYGNNMWEVFRQHLFLFLDWAGLDEDEDAHVWEDNWDDDNVEDDFSNQLRWVLSQILYSLVLIIKMECVTYIWWLTSLKDH